MKKQPLATYIVTVFLILTSIFFLTPVTAADKDWTILIYIDADNSLSEYADYDIDEIWTAGSDSNINIIVYVDYNFLSGKATKLWYINTKPTANTALSLSAAGLEPEPNSAHSNTLYKLMKYVYNKYPSTYFGVIIWNHGVAWGGNNADDTSDDITDLKEMKSTFSRFYSETNKYIDLLGFDQCLMQTVSVVYNVKNYVNYIVASEALEPAYGWEYTYPLTQLKATPTMTPITFGEKIIDGYDTEYSGDRTITLSLINVTAFELLSHDLNYYSQLLEHNGRTEWSNIKRSIVNTEKFVAYADLVLYDLYDFTEQLENRVSNTSIINIGKAIRAKINNTVLYEKHGDKRDESTGLSWYMSKNQGSYNEMYKYNYWCDENTHDEFLETFIIKENGINAEPPMPTMELVSSIIGNILYVNNSVTTPDNTGSEVKVSRGAWLRGTTTYTTPKTTTFYGRTWNGTDYSQVNSSSFSNVIKIITQYTGSEYTIRFKSGWNMFGLPLDVEITAKELLTKTSGGIELVKRSSAGQWFIYLNEKSSPDDDFSLTLGEGYYIYVNQDTLYTFSGISISHSLTLAKDWSFVSYSGTSTKASSFASIVGGQNTLTYRNPVTDRYESFIESKVMGEDFDISKGNAFFIWDDEGESVTI